MPRLLFGGYNKVYPEATRLVPAGLEGVAVEPRPVPNNEVMTAKDEDEEKRTVC